MQVQQLQIMLSFQLFTCVYIIVTVWLHPSVQLLNKICFVVYSTQHSVVLHTVFYFWNFKNHFISCIPMYASAVSLKHLNVFLSSPHCWYGGFNSCGGRPPLIGGRSGGSGNEGEEKEGSGEWSTVTLQSRGQSK